MSHEPIIKDEGIACACGWQMLDIGTTFGVQLWAQHWCEAVFLPNYNAQLKSLRTEESPKEVDILFGVEWKPGHTEYLGDSEEAHNVLFEADDEEAKLVKTITIKEYL